MGSGCPGAIQNAKHTTAFLFRVLQHHTIVGCHDRVTFLHVEGLVLGLYSVDDGLFT